MTNLEAAFIALGEQIGAQGIALAVVVANLHQAGSLNGRSVAQSLRIFGASPPNVQLSLDALAEAIGSHIDQLEQDGPHTLRPVP